MRSFVSSQPWPRPQPKPRLRIRHVVSHLTTTGFLMNAITKSRMLPAHLSLSGVTEWMGNDSITPTFFPFFPKSYFHLLLLLLLSWGLVLQGIHVPPPFTVGREFFFSLSLSTTKLYMPASTMISQGDKMQATEVYLADDDEDTRSETEIPQHAGHGVWRGISGRIGCNLLLLAGIHGCWTAVGPATTVSH